MPIDLNFTIAAPLLALAAGTLLILLLDLLFKYERIHGALYFTAIGGILLSGFYLMPLWQVGRTAPPTGFNAFLVMDRFGVVFSGVLLVAALLAAILSIARPEEDRSGYLALLLWGAMGMVTLAGAGNLMTIFLGLELLSLALYVMVAFDPKHPQAREAALKYFVLGSVAAAFLIFGFALIYGAVGTMSIAGIAKAAASFSTAGGFGAGLYYKVGLGLAIVGFAFKLALVPFHVWAPDVYQGAPTPVTAYMSVGTKAAAFAAMARLLAAAVPAEYQAAILLPVSVLAAVSMVVGSSVGIWQDDLKRLMAYSGIANAGYLIMAIPGLGLAGLSAAAYYLLAYGFTAMGIFAIVKLLEEEGEEGAKLATLTGLFYRRPGLAVALALFMFGLTGLPPAGGFIGKFLLAMAAVNGQAWIVLTGLVLSTGISAYVYLRVVGTAFKKPAERAERAVMAGAQEVYGPARTAAQVVLAIAVAGTLWLGLLPESALKLVTVAFGAY
ncbi:MAG: NADH-quinone oxidoreductase subunit N [Bacillota bacterium]